MPKTKIDLNTNGIRLLITGEEIMNYVLETAISRLPVGCDTEIVQDNRGAKFPRNKVIMFPITDEAIRQCYENDLLINAISR